MCLFLWMASLWLAVAAPPPEPVAILAVTPSPEELGHGWTTNVVAYLLDPKSQPPEIDYRTDPKTSLLLEYQRSVMLTNNRTGCGLILYGRGNLVMNIGLYRVYIQRWDNTRSLHNSWVGWKMDPSRVLRADVSPVGDDCFWTEEWWRQTKVRNNFVFRRGLFHVTVEAGSDSDYRPMVRLAEVIDAKIRGRPVPPESTVAPSRQVRSTQ
jgi:hypothetical protein